MSTDSLAVGRADAFRAEVARTFGVEETAVVVTSGLGRPQFAAIEWRIDPPDGELSVLIPPQDAFLLAVQLGGPRETDYWEDGRFVGRFTREPGQTAISDLRRRPQILVDTPVHMLLLYLPRSGLGAVAEEAGLASVTDLHFEPGVGFRDDTFWGLAMALLPAIRTPDKVNWIFTDHIALAVESHAATLVEPDISGLICGGLAPWQERRAKEMMLADSGGLSVSEIAKACGLSASHFARAFRKCTGFTPHTWLVRARVQRAMQKLRANDETVESVAHACGFADPSHFARVFTRHVGLRPSTWRRIQ